MTSRDESRQEFKVSGLDSGCLVVLFMNMKTLKATVRYGK